jgi:hypothetical protein
MNEVGMPLLSSQKARTRIFIYGGQGLYALVTLSALFHQEFHVKVIKVGMPLLPC